MLALFGIVSALVAGEAISAVLAGVTLAEWASIAGVLLTVSGDALKVFLALHPSLKHLEPDITAGKPAHEIAHKAAQLRFDVPPEHDLASDFLHEAARLSGNEND